MRDYVLVLVGFCRYLIILFCSRELGGLSGYRFQMIPLFSIPFDCSMMR